VRLADFILREMEPILAECDAFAASHAPTAGQLDAFALHHHASEILRAIALHLNADGKPMQPGQNAEGRGTAPRDALSTAAHMHALRRAQGGFSAAQLAGDYCAMRSCVLRLWALAPRREPTDPTSAMQDALHFSEAMDHALIGSVATFSQEIERARNLFLAVIGHDLRNPLETIQTTATYLSRVGGQGVTADAAGRIIRSSVRIRSLLDDLLAYSRGALGEPISVAIAHVDLAQVCAAELEALRSAHRDRLIRYQASGDLRGEWDAARIQQALSNLVQNALDYGARDGPVDIRATGHHSDVELSVHNRGAAIPQEAMARIFEPLARGDFDHQLTRNDAHLGLGLFIAREIARAHGGDIHVSSDERETAFFVRLPRAKPRHD
jgi:signal transduction histidine kinase